VQLHEVLLLRQGELWLAGGELACGLGNRHALPSAGTDQVGLELGDHAEKVEREAADGVIDRSPEVQGNTRPRQLVSDVRRVTQRPGKTVQLRDNQNIAGTSCRNRFSETWPRSSRARQALVNMHVLPNFPPH
jgi:hypothetical protein